MISDSGRFCECELELKVQQAALDEAEKLLNALTTNADELRDRSRKLEEYIVSYGLPIPPV